MSNREVIYNRIFFSIVTIFVLFLSFLQSYNQHWTAVVDSDISNLYNSLRVINGEYQDHREHGFTQYLIYGIFIKIFSIFDTSLVSNVEDLIALDNSNIVLQKIFLISRFANSIILLLFIIYFYKISKIFELKNIDLYFLILILIFSKNFLLDLTILRPDIVAITFFLISLYYLINFIKNQNRIHYILISSFFITLGLLAKIQLIIFLPFLLIFFNVLNFFEMKKKDYEFLNLRYFKYCILFYGIFIIAYILTQIYLHQYPFSKFNTRPFMDLYLFILFNIFYISFLFFLGKKNILYFKSNFIVYSIFLLGIILSLIVLNFLSYLNVIGLSPTVLLRLTNPFFYLTVYSPFLIDTIGINFIIDRLLNISYDFTILLLQYLVLTIIFIFSIFNDFKKQKFNYFFYKLILFLFISILLLQFFFRYYAIYDVYILPIYLILFGLIVKNYINKIKYSLFAIFLLFVVSNTLFSENHYFNKNFPNALFNRDSQFVNICKNDKNIRYMIYLWSNKMNENFFQKLCSSNNIKFIKNN